MTDPFETDYRYPPSCDVKDQTRLECFRKKREEWVIWLKYDEHHAIQDTLQEMLWSNALFRLVNEIALQTRDIDGSFAIRNEALARLITSGWVHEQLNTIRRLLESNLNQKRNPKPEDKQIISLRRLIEDVTENRDLLTREIFVAHDGLPYDFEAVREADMETLRQLNRESGGPQWRPTSGRDVWDTAKEKHDLFDQLSGVAPDARNRCDRVSDHAFQRIEDVLSAAPFEPMKTYLEKIIAHAATPGSRKEHSLEGVSLAEISECHRALVQATVMTSRMFDIDVIIELRNPEGDFMKSWSSPFCPADRLDSLRETWGSLTNSVKDWGRID